MGEERTRQACSFCRERKKKCDGQNPCSNCVKRDVVCTFPDPKKRGRKTREEDGETLGVSNSESNGGIEGIGTVPDAYPLHQEGDEDQLNQALSEESLNLDLNEEKDPWLYFPENLRAQYKRYHWTYFTFLEVVTPIVGTHWASASRYAFFELSQNSALIQFLSSIQSIKSTTSTLDSSSPYSNSSATSGFSSNSSPPYGQNGESHTNVYKGIHPSNVSPTAPVLGIFQGNRLKRKTNHEVTRQNHFPGSTQCECYQSAQVGLVWAILALGALRSGDQEESISSAIKSRQYLTSSILCVKDFELSVMFFKLSMDVISSLPSPPSDLLGVRDFNLLMTALPVSPSSPVPLSLSNQDYLEYRRFVMDPSMNEKPPSLDEIRLGGLKLIGSVMGELMYIERTKGLFLTEERYLIMDRNIELCLHLCENWMFSGPMTPMVEAACYALRVWYIFHFLKLTKALECGKILEDEAEELKGCSRPLISVRVNRLVYETTLPRSTLGWKCMVRDKAMELYEKEKEQIHYSTDELTRSIQSFLPFGTKPFSSSSSYSSLDSSTISNQLEDTFLSSSHIKVPTSVKELEDNAKIAVQKLTDIVKKNRWRKYIDVIFVLLFFNAGSIFCHFDFWKELEVMFEFYQDVGHYTFFVKHPTKKIGTLLELYEECKKECELNNTDMPSFQMGRMPISVFLDGFSPNDLRKMDGKDRWLWSCLNTDQEFQDILNSLGLPT